MRSAPGLITIMFLLLATLALAQDPSRGSRPLDLPEAHASATYTGRHALVIGINDYQDPSFGRLSCAVTDAQGVANVLVSSLGFPKNRVRLIENAAATRAAIEQALEEWLTDRDAIAENDLVVLFFAGHGLTRALDGGKARGYLVPVDGRHDTTGEPSWATLISIQRLEEMSEMIRAKHVLFILDCCFGGLAVERGAADVPLVGGLTTPARNVITAGTAQQTVLDGGSGGHSIFTGALLDAMRGAADDDGDGAVNANEIYGYVALKLEAQTHGRQTPVQGTFPGHKGGRVALFAPDVKPTGLTAKERLEDLRLDNEEYRRETERLSDAVVVTDLLHQADDLWPRRPERIPAMRQWLGRAAEVRSRAPDHRQALARVREEARLTLVLAGAVRDDTALAVNWDMTDPRLRWRHETFSRLLDQMQVLGDVVDDVERRVVFAEAIRRHTIDDVDVEWRRALAAIRDHTGYDGLELKPIVGLVPLGPDPESGLWEFWVYETGERPERNADGRFCITGDTGLVLVLLPGDTFDMGSRVLSDRSQRGPNVDPYAEGEGEGPVHEVTLAPFFLSKYEMTQGQWLRATGRNPSGYGSGTSFGDKRHDLSHPVEQVSWRDCEQVLARLGLDLPTEAQWEYAARAGTTTIWWTGDEKQSIAGAANLADRFAKANRGERSFLYDLEFDDGYTMHAPVGHYRPNLFGMHDTMGNVWEWCRDWYGSYRYRGAERTGEREVPEQFRSSKVCRGGGYTMDTTFLRSSYRELQSPDVRGVFIGVRPALNLSADQAGG